LGRNVIIKFFVCIFTFLHISDLSAQDQEKKIDRVFRESPAMSDSLGGDFRPILADTSQLGRRPTIRASYSDSIMALRDSASAMLKAAEAADSISRRNNKYRSAGDIETTINYRAQDSIFFDMNNQSLMLYGQTHIDYGAITLDASRTDVDMFNKTINSVFTIDSAGKKVGRPVFSEGSDVYETEKIVYNYDTKRAQIRGVVTEQDGAFMHGNNVRKNEKDEMFIRRAKYTTCNLAEPHFFIESDKLKVIPGNKVISGPFNLRFGDVPTPLWFPFGMFPQPKQRVSGLIFPTYGEERNRGFFLREGGYYWAINEYLDLRATGSIYSKGSTGVTVNSNYKIRYKFSGSWNFSFNQLVTDEAEGGQNSKDFWLRWNHRQDSKGSSNFSASVSMGTSSFNKNSNVVAQDFNRSINSQFASNITYSKRFQGTPFNMTLNARQNQNLQTEIAKLSAPELTFNTNRVYPFKGIFKNQNNPIAKINLSHNFVAKNELTNAASTASFPFDVVGEDNSSQEQVDFWEDFDEVLSRGRIGGRHQLPISTSVSLLKFFTVSPSFNYQEVWYLNELDYTWDPEQEAVQVDTLDGFSRAASWSSGASLNTIIYGTYFFKGKMAENIQAIRHVMTPSLSFSYSPDFGESDNSAYSYVQKNTNGDSVRVSKYQGYIFGSPTGSENKSLSFSLQNKLELKVKDKEDTTGVGFKKVKIFDNLSMSSGYNFAADSFQLADMRISTRTSFFNNAFGLSLSGTIDPYQYELLSESINSSGVRVVDQRAIDRLSILDGKGLGKVNSLTASMNLNLRPKSGNSSRNSSNLNPDASSGRGELDPGLSNFDNGYGGEELSEIEEAELEYIAQNPDQYVDFSIPWSLRMSYSVNRRQNGFEEANIRQTFSFSGDLSLTPKTKITFNSGFDFDKQTFTSTRIGISRDLHCWSLNFNWVPFGAYQSFSLVIRPKSSILQDLKLQKRRSFQDFFQ
jgi:hypothetical protein